jgi:hypothetical protein
VSAHPIRSALEHRDKRVAILSRREDALHEHSERDSEKDAEAAATTGLVLP